jgi:hypothetical protein
MLTLEHYRRHIVNSWSHDALWEKVLLNLPNSIARYYRQGMIRTFSTWRYLELWDNHPLVNSGNAYWTNDTTLCLGYKLKTNNAIFRPIFSTSRQELINEFQKNIKKGVLRRESKTMWLELVRIQRLPIEIVDKVFEYVVLIDSSHIFGKCNLADLLRSKEQ